MNKIYLRAKCFFFNLCSGVVVTQFHKKLSSRVQLFWTFIVNWFQTWKMWRQKELRVKVVSHSETFVPPENIFLDYFRFIQLKRQKNKIHVKYFLTLEKIKSWRNFIFPQKNPPKFSWKWFFCFTHEKIKNLAWNVFFIRKFPLKKIFIKLFHTWNNFLKSGF